MVEMPARSWIPTVASALVALALSSVAGASEYPGLPPGKLASIAGTHVTCRAGEAYDVTCKKTGGLTATISATGVVHVTRDARKLTSTSKARVLRNNGGFQVLGTGGVGLYCHVYVAGKPTMSCSIDDPIRIRNSHGFDMSEGSVVVFRYDQTGLRHDVKTLRQP